MPRPESGDALRETVALAGGGYVVFELSGVVSGMPESIDEDERERMREILAQTIAQAELFAYSVETVTDATVRVPDEVLEPQF
jgi:hypothetical protein